MRGGSRATATSPPSCGTPRASARPTASARSQSIAAPAGHHRGQQVDHRRGGRDAGRARQGDGRPALRRRRQRDLPLRVGHVLRLVPRADQGPDRRRDQGGRRLGARPDPGHAPPVHALRHRGAVARAGRAAVRADRRASGPSRRRAVDAGGQGRGRMADRADRATCAPPRTSSASRPAPSSTPSCADPSRHRARGDRRATPRAIDRLARLSAIRFDAAPAGAAMQIGAGDATCSSFRSKA